MSAVFRTPALGPVLSAILLATSFAGPPAGAASPVPPAPAGAARSTAVGHPYSDSIAGYVVRFDAAANSFDLRTAAGQVFPVHLTETTYAEVLRNLGEPYAEATDSIRAFLVPGRYLLAYGIFYPGVGTREFEAKQLIFTGAKPDEYRFEAPNWWTDQIRHLADFYLKAEFGDGPFDFRNYRTDLTLEGNHMAGGRQETATLSRLIYGLATAYMLTGDDTYLEAANKGTRYLRDHMRAVDPRNNLAYWLHGLDIGKDGKEHRLLTSEFEDDKGAIPLYEQIYALAGPVQTYRITGDPAILHDAQMTVNFFDTCYLDRRRGGYFSHVEPTALDPRGEALGRNRARKNWNSIGDHAPAYLINLYLATGQKRWADMLERTADAIVEHFPDDGNSPFVRERFLEDWSPDTSWGWQKDRAVVGHNLKIAWNLTRIHDLHPDPRYLSRAIKIAETMPAMGADRQRGGWYDTIERSRKPGDTSHHFPWNDRKTWWQQEQGILAYLILAGAQPRKRPDYLRQARETEAFYNAWFLDHESGGVYFNVLAGGVPYLRWAERKKGSHAMSGYHAFELAYLATVYQQLLIARGPLDLYFNPQPDGFPDHLLRVAPDLLPPKSVRIGQVWIDGFPSKEFDADALTVKLPAVSWPLKVRVRLEPR